MNRFIKSVFLLFVFYSLNSLFSTVHSAEKGFSSRDMNELNFSQDSLALLQLPPKPKGVNDTIRVYSVDYQGERIPWVLIRPVDIVRQRVFLSAQSKAKYMRLRYDVMKVLPYVEFAQNRYDKLQSDLENTNKRSEERKLIREAEREIKDMFNKEVKKLTVSQGKILLKLIDRQTGMTSYDVVKDLKGGVNAFMFQSMARVFGHNLKSEYDPQEDYEIENIIRSLRFQPQFSDLR